MKLSCSCAARLKWVQRAASQANRTVQCPEVQCESHSRRSEVNPRSSDHLLAQGNSLLVLADNRCTSSYRSLSSCDGKERLLCRHRCKLTKTLRIFFLFYQTSCQHEVLRGEFRNVFTCFSFQLPVTCRSEPSAWPFAVECC